jgi:hypothetical protein
MPGDPEVCLLQCFVRQIMIASRCGEELSEECRPEFAVKFLPRVIVPSGERGRELEQQPRWGADSLHAQGEQGGKYLRCE